MQSRFQEVKGLRMAGMSARRTREHILVLLARLSKEFYSLARILSATRLSLEALARAHHLVPIVLLALLLLLHALYTASCSFYLVAKLGAGVLSCLHIQPGSHARSEAGCVSAYQPLEVRFKLRPYLSARRANDCADRRFSDFLSILLVRPSAETRLTHTSPSSKWP